MNSNKTSNNVYSPTGTPLISKIKEYRNGIKQSRIYFLCQFAEFYRGLYSCLKIKSNKMEKLGYPGLHKIFRKLENLIYLLHVLVVIISFSFLASFLSSIAVSHGEIFSEQMTHSVENNPTIPQFMLYAMAILTTSIYATTFRWIVKPISSCLYYDRFYAPLIFSVYFYFTSIVILFVNSIMINDAVIMFKNQSCKNFVKQSQIEKLSFLEPCGSSTSFFLNLPHLYGFQIGHFVAIIIYVTFVVLLYFVYRYAQIFLTRGQFSPRRT